MRVTRSWSASGKRVWWPRATFRFIWTSWRTVASKIGERVRRLYPEYNLLICIWFWAAEVVFFTFALFYARESECLNAGNLYSWNGESWAMEPRIQLTESAIPFTIWIQNPCSIDKDWNPVPGLRNPRPSVHRGVSKTPNGLPASEKQRNKVSFFCNFENLPRLFVLFRVSVSNCLSCSE